MSRVGKLLILVPKDVDIKINGLAFTAKGPRGELFKTFKGNINVSIENNAISVLPLSEDKEARAMWGTVRSIINNMVLGVKEGFTKELEITGVGYRASLKGNYLNLSLGKSHNTKIEIPSDIRVESPKPNLINLFCIDKEKLGKFAAMIIAQRSPEPYKGKGIKLKGQYIYRKEAKK